MKLSDSILHTATTILRRFGARRIVLFGSAADSPETARDLDLAVEGLPAHRLLDACLALERELRVPFDLVRLERRDGFAELVVGAGRVLYDDRPTAR